MSDGPVLEQGGNLLVELLRRALIPGVLYHQEDIGLANPTEEKDCRLAVSLYDMELVRPYGTPRPVRVGEDQIRGPGCIFALHFLVYANRKVPFDSMTAADEMALLEGTLRAVHNATPQTLAGETVEIRFQSISAQEKISLWQSLGVPLQPAVYLVMEPLVIPSDKLERFVPVREVNLKAHKKEGGESL